MSRRRTITIALAGVLALMAGAARGQDLASFEKRVTRKTLDNGLTVLVCERPGAPVFSFFTHVDAGSAQEKEPGLTPVMVRVVLKRREPASMVVAMVGS